MGYSTTRSKYYPLDHYLRHYKCSSEPLHVHIATSDPTGVKKKNARIGRNNARLLVGIGCTSIEFHFLIKHSKSVVNVW